MHVAQDRGQRRTIVNTVINLRFPYKVGNLLSCSETVSFSRRTVFHVIGWLVGWLVGRSVGRSVGQSVRITLQVIFVVKFLSVLAMF
jgi:hypothetical protein